MATTTNRTTLGSFRDTLEISQQEMANLLGVSISFYTKVESHQRNPSYNFIKKFVAKFPFANIKAIFFTC